MGSRIEGGVTIDIDEEAIRQPDGIAGRSIVDGQSKSGGKQIIKT
jgi:hypothetical protein